MGSSAILPFAAALIAWFFATGAILWLDRRPPETWGASLVGATGVAGLAFAAVLITAGGTGPGAAYAAFAAAILIWGWHEMSFLMGFVTGPRRRPLPAGATGFRRFRLATATLLHHEIALAVTALALLLVTWGQPTQVAAHAFLLLFGLRLSTKFNIFFGVPHFSDEMLPAHLDYLRSYFRTRRTTPLLPLALAGCLALVWLLVRAGAGAPAGSGAAVQYQLLAALALLGTIEHLFLALPLKDSALFTWLVKGGKPIIKGSPHGL